MKVNAGRRESTFGEKEVCAEANAASIIIERIAL
jgi:hypothetical protein